MFTIKYYEWRNGDFAVLPPILRPAGAQVVLLKKNVPEKFRKKMTFFDQKAVFQRNFVKGPQLRLNVFWGKLTEICEEKIWKNVFWKLFFFFIFCGPSELRPSRMGKVREYPLRHWILRTPLLVAAKFTRFKKCLKWLNPASREKSDCEGDWIKRLDKMSS